MPPETPAAYFRPQLLHAERNGENFRRHGLPVVSALLPAADTAPMPAEEHTEQRQKTSAPLRGTDADE
ncbi:hypothetical protein LG35_07440 [Alistipes inops]|uniref:Uncharacterized protein n=1 Tax=Alistipes inops TaxID=1501391 RepID=A0ABR4YJ37_9BACT|nr:hypothetical protein LG35_07440 [Alistipes inops]OKY83518.1 MAG: hypothetical protein BHV63_02440 [Alistipes sp. 56_11]